MNENTLYRAASPSRTQTLSSARTAKQDEFYTQLGDISNELRHYREHLRGKVVLCNCDDPFESAFFQYFALKFNELGLKKLICTSYAGSPIVNSQLPFVEFAGSKPHGREPYAVEINEVPDFNHDGAINREDVEYLLRHDKNASRPLKGDETYGGGDFRSRECVEVLKTADVVVTNPPFSLFREYVAQLVEPGKQFLIIGNVNAITYKEVFRLIKENRLWLGQSIHSGDREFRVPDHYPLQAAGFRVDENGTKYIRVKGVRWFTNMDYESRHEPIPLFKRYSPEEYPRYANSNAIEVSKVADIPSNYHGEMGVPITFLDRYNPEQFEILGSSHDMGVPMSSIAQRGTYVQGGPRFYLPDGDGRYRRMYDRLVIKRVSE